MTNHSHRATIEREQPPREECHARCAPGRNKVIKDRLFHFITAGKAI